MNGPPPSSAPSRLRDLVAPPLIALALAALFLATFFWPLPRHLRDGIVENTQPPGHPALIQPVSPGDPLQLMYHFWKFTDMLSGHTPWFHNIYEFNTGDDAGRYEPSTYYFPFSLFFAIGFWIDGHAAGWNLASFLSIALTLWLTFLLARRYTGHPAAAWACALLAMALPYRWLSLGGGSPTGFTMAWIPLLFIGLDRMVHERSVAGGALAGLTIALASFADAHCFFFSVIATPAWFLFAWAVRSAGSGFTITRDDAKATFGGGALIALLAGFAYFAQKLMTATIEKSEASTGRTLQEVALFTPWPDGLLSWTVHGVSEHIYVGFTLIALLLLGLVVAVRALRRASDRPATRTAVVALGLTAFGIGLVIALALGANGPFEGRVFLWARELIPPYKMIRQTAKVYCLLPSLIAVFAAVSFRLIRLAPWKPATVLWIALAAAGVLEMYVRITPRIGLIPEAQGAYAAVADDARANNRIPRALVVTLWPGESHFASVYQHWSSEYHIRMINGYFPFVPQSYVTNVFQRLQSANIGALDDTQLDWLLERGFHYLLVHENIYPNKVSPYPVGYALHRLLSHPRVEPLAQDGAVWSFRLRERPRAATPPAPPVVWPTDRFVEMERLRASRDFLRDDPAASGGRFVALTTPGTTLNGLRWDLGPGIVNHIAFRVRGQGNLVFDRLVAGQSTGTITLPVDSDTWTWVQVPMPQPETRRNADTVLTLTEGAIDLDLAMLVGGTLPSLEPGNELAFAPAHLFRAGYSTPALSEVVFDPAREPAGEQLYGPNLPLPAGRYELRVDFATTAPDTTPLGTWEVLLRPDRPLASATLIAGTPLVLAFEVPDNLPLNTILKLHPFTHAVTVRTFALKRIE